MDLNLTKREVELLLELLALGNHVVNGPRPSEQPSAEHRALAEMLYAEAQEQGFGYLIDFDEESDAFVPSEALKSRLDLGDYLREYDDWVFWDELALRLAERDLADEVGRAAFDRMPEHERRERTEKIAEEYDKIFDKNGIDRLRVEGRRRERRSRRDALAEKLRRLFDDSDQAT